MEEKSFGVVYAIRHKKSGKAYIGQTQQNPHLRFSAHLSSRSGTTFYTDLKKFGRTAFELEILRHCATAEELNKWESHHIRELQKQSPLLCYNVRVIPRYIPGAPLKSVNSKSRMISMRIPESNEIHLTKKAKANPRNVHNYIATEINALIEEDRIKFEKTGNYPFAKK